MESANTHSNLGFREWLEDKPHAWVQVLVVRAMLRSIPFLTAAEFKNSQVSIPLMLRAAIIAWASREVSTSTRNNIILTAYRALLENLQEDMSVARATARAGLEALRVIGASSQPSAVASATSCMEDVVAAFVQSHLHVNRVAVFNERTQAARRRDVWQSTWADCDFLIHNKDRYSIVEALNRGDLWFSVAPEYWLLQWQETKNQSLAIDPNYSVWTDWYERRIRGERAAFDIPGDKGRKEDTAILARLAEATDEDFWGKGYEYVNAELSRWLEEARERVAAATLASADEVPQLEDQGELGAINPDPQDARSPTFGHDATGRIAIKANAGADQLRSDPQSLTRHARALQMAQKLGDAVRGHNDAGYMTGMVDDYVAAMGGGLDSADPSGLVFAGDQLREAIAKHRAAKPDDDLQPLPPSIDRAATAYLAAHNMFVGSDPFLDDLDRTTRGPDAPLPAANPDEIGRVATAARQADILAEPTYDYMVAATEKAPANYDPADRHSRFAAGLAQNFARYGIEFLWTYPTEAAWAGIAAGVGATIVLGPVVAVGGTVAGVTVAYHMARNIIANEPVYRKLLTTSPAGEDNFNRLMHFLKSLPIKSLKDD